jgi:carboxyl-terminal processing protease
MESNRNATKILIGCGIAILLVGFLGAGLLGGYVGHDVIHNLVTTGSVNAATGESSSTSSEQLFAPFWEAWHLVHDQYLEQPVDDEKNDAGAIRGMMDSLGDPHSGYMDPVEYSNATAPLEGYSGIGAWVNTEGEYLTITEPMKGSPAEAAGLKAGDQIIAIDGADMNGTIAELARQKVLGPAGTKVILTILREGVEQPFDVSVTRQQITIPSTEYKMLDNHIAYVRLNAFSSTTEDELHAALEDLIAQNPKSLILDLRNNGGGYLDTAIAVGSEFIPSGVVAYEEYGMHATHSMLLVMGSRLKSMVVLVNGGQLQLRGRGRRSTGPRSCAAGWGDNLWEGNRAELDCIDG